MRLYLAKLPRDSDVKLYVLTASQPCFFRKR